MLELPNWDEEVLDSVDDAVWVGLGDGGVADAYRGGCALHSSRGGKLDLLAEERGVCEAASQESAASCRHGGGGCEPCPTLEQSKSKRKQAYGGTHLLCRDVFAWWKSILHILFHLILFASPVGEVYIALQ
jgi:hypothetical protein